MCDFPARELLERRRQVVEAMDPYAAYKIVRCIDEARWRHFELTGCDCWRQARAEAAAAKQEVANG